MSKVYLIKNSGADYVELGKDPVALDTACLDLLQGNSGEKLFENGRASLQHAEKIGLGTMKYQLIEIN